MPSSDTGHWLARPTLRRLQRRRHRASLKNESIDALSSMVAAQDASYPVSLAEPCSLTAIAAAVAHAGPPANVHSLGVLSELCFARGYSGTHCTFGCWFPGPTSARFSSQGAQRDGGTRFCSRVGPPARAKICPIHVRHFCVFFGIWTTSTRDVLVGRLDLDFFIALATLFHLSSLSRSRSLSLEISFVDTV